LCVLSGLQYNFLRINKDPRVFLLIEARLARTQNSRHHGIIASNLENFGLFIGPVFTREAAVVPRRKRHFVTRGVYTLSLLLLTFTAWLVLTGTQRILNIGDMARFGAALFQILAPLQQRCYRKRSRDVDLAVDESTFQQ